MSTTRTLALVGALLSLSACAQVCAPDQVAMAVARLTTLNADSAITALDDDETCGFASQVVLDAVVQDGDYGDDGSLTWTVTDCSIDLGSGFDFEPNCDTGEHKTARGKVTIKRAVKTVTGILMDNPDSPILPTSDKAVTIVVEETVFEDFETTQSDSDVSMTWVEGSISGTLYPRLAKSTPLGACSILTSHKGFTGVKYTPSTVVLHAPDQEVEVEVGGSDLQGQVGQNKGKAEDGFVENDLRGSIEIWGTSYDIPIEDDDGGLDPDYDETEFYAQDECKENVLLPISFDCG